MAVRGPTLQPKLSSFYLYQDHEACGVSPEKTRNQIDPVLGRHAGVESVEREAVVPPCVSSEAPDITRVSGQSQQEHSGPDQEVGVPRIPDRLNPDGYLSPKAQDALNHSVGKQPSDQGEGESERAGKYSGHNGCSSPGSPPSPTPLQLPGKCQVLSPQMEPPVLSASEHHTRHERGPQLVDPQSQQVQWEGHGNLTVGCGHRIRCLETRLGGMFRRNLNRGSKDETGTATQHQLPRAVSVISRPPDICPQGGI